MSISVSNQNVMYWLCEVFNGVVGVGESVLEALSISEIKRRLVGEPENYIVEGLLPANEVSVAVGDSGLGKTPLAYQLGISVAAGVPFLDMPTKQTRVLYLDLENGRKKRPPLAEDIARVLQVREVPDEFLVAEDSCSLADVAKAVKEYKPGLIIGDTLRALEPGAEDSNSTMGRFLKESRAIAQENDCAFLYLHHINKPREDEAVKGSLEENPVLHWLNKASGARSLVNQTNTRIGIDKAHAAHAKDAALVMKWFVKLEGEGENIYIQRVLGDDGFPTGYRRITGVALLGNPEQRAAFEKLPQGLFTFKQAMWAYGKSDKPTREWLLKCIGAGILRQPFRGAYERVPVRRVE
jgi:AAA domain